MQSLERVSQRAVANLVAADDEFVPIGQIESRKLRQAAHQSGRFRELLLQRDQPECCRRRDATACPNEPDADLS